MTKPALIHVVDVETTGLLETDRVVELAAVEVTGVVADPTTGLVQWRVGAPVSSFVNPQRPIPPEASGVHHICDEDVSGAPWLGDAIGEVLPLWETTVDVVAAHNAKFDKPFLPPLAVKRWICTWRCSMHVFPDAPSFSNGALFYYLGFKRGLGAPAPHRAGFDVWMTAHILTRLLEERSVDDLLKLSRKAVVLKRVPFGKHFNELWTEIPDGYLDWASKQDFEPDVKFTVKTEIARRAAL